MSVYALGFVPTAFNEQAMALLAAAKHHALDVLAARKMLASSPLDDASLEWHGRLLTRYFQAVGTHHDAGDTALLGAYLHALLALPVERWMKEASYIQPRAGSAMTTYRPRPLYDGIHGVATVLEQHGMARGHPVLLSAIEQGLLDPDRIWKHLDTGLDAQKEYLLDKHGELSTLPHTAQGLFLRALRPVLLDTEWRPSETGMYEQFWGVHGLGEQSDTACRRSDAFVRLLLSKGDEHLHGALLYMAQHEMDLETLELFFPLPLQHCRALPVLHALLLIFAPGKTTNAGPTHATIVSRMREHHASLLDLIDIHLALHPAPFEAQHRIGILMEPFERLLGRLPALEYEAGIDGALFEGHCDEQ